MCFLPHSGMAGTSKRPKLTMEPDELERLWHLRQAPTAPLREVQRAQILTRYHAGETVAQIASNLHMTRKSVAKWTNRALAVGPRAALKDAYHRPRGPSIAEEARLGSLVGVHQAQRSGLRRRDVDTERIGQTGVNSG